MSKRDEGQPFPWPWYIAIVASVGATGFAFAVSSPAGFVLVGVTTLVFVSFLIWAVRRARRLRAGGQPPNLANMQERLRRRAVWLTALAVLTAVACALALATNDGHTPTWLLVLPPALISVGVTLIWLIVGVLLPRLQRRQASGSD